MTFIPIVVPTNGQTYVIVFYFFWFIAPVAFAFECVNHPTPTNVLTELALVLATLGTLLLNIYRCSSAVLSYWQGLCLVSGRWLTGCVQISAFIILPIVCWMHLHASVVSLVSLVAGAPFARRHFLWLCYILSRRAFDLPTVQESLATVTN